MDAFGLGLFAGNRMRRKIIFSEKVANKRATFPEKMRFL